MRSDVLQAGQKERIIMRMVAVVAHQRAIAALRMIELARAEAVVDEQHRALLQSLREAVDQAARGEADFAWLMQELRVSLFAQELKMPVIVSVKLLEKMLATLRT